MSKCIEPGYVDPKDFRDFKSNTDKLIGILNHSMTEMKIDLCWIKKIIGWQTGLLTGIFVAIILGGIKWLTL